MAVQDLGDLADGKRYGCGTWLVPTAKIPAVAKWMTDTLPEEKYDTHFHGQHLHTTYFDTLGLKCRKARLQAERYAVLRLRCYNPGGSEAYALSVKTENEKWRQEISSDLAEQVLPPGARVLQLVANLVPSNLMARLLEVTLDKPLSPVVLIHAHRFAVESQAERFTLDVAVMTDTGKDLPAGVLEYKSIDPDAAPPSSLVPLSLHPFKLSKFLWSTDF